MANDKKTARKMLERETVTYKQLKKLVSGAFPKGESSVNKNITKEQSLLLMGTALEKYQNSSTRMALSMQGLMAQNILRECL